MSAEPTYVIFTTEELGRPKVVTAVDEIPARLSKLEYIVVARLPYRELDNGLPADGELSVVTKLEGQLQEALVPLGAFHLGHITFNGAMQVAFLAPKGMPPELTFKAGLLKKVKVDLDVRHDPSHNWFATELAPSAIAREIHNYRNLQQKLADLGDNPALVRQVDFWAYFTTAEQRATFKDAVVAGGYRVTSEDMAEGAYPYGFQFAADSDTIPQTMATRCAYLRGQAKLVNGDFDGWACPVKKD